MEKWKRKKKKKERKKTEYLQLYPTGLSPKKFYGTATIHNFSNGGNIAELPVSPIFFNIGTALYYLSKYLAKLLSPLNHLKDDHQLVSFNLPSLFTKVPLDYTIYFVLRHIYTQKERNWNQPNKERNKRPTYSLYEKSTFFGKRASVFTERWDSYGPLGQVKASIFMVELDRNLLPTLSQYMTSWKRYVDDTISYVKVDCIEHVLNALNSFHANNFFNYEQECDGMISFLDILIIRKNYTIENTVYRKQTHNDKYLHWE